MLQGQTFLPVLPSSFQQIVMGTLPCVSRSSAEDSEANKHQSPGAVCSPVIKADLPNKWFQDQVVRAQRERYRVQRTWDQKEEEVKRWQWPRQSHVQQSGGERKKPCVCAGKLLLKFTWKSKGPNWTKAGLTEEGGELDTYSTRRQDVPQISHNACSVVLVPGGIIQPIEQSQGPQMRPHMCGNSGSARGGTLDQRGKE